MTTTIIISLSIIVLVGMIVYFILINGKLPKKSEFNIDFEQVRNLSKSLNKDLPIKINMLTIAYGELPSWAVSAGDFSNQKFKIDFPCFQLVYNNRTAIIEAPYNKRLFDRFPFGREYFQNNYELMQKALIEAEFILPTHEHWDHLGGVAQSEHFSDIIKKTILTKEQINGPTIADAEFPENAFADYNPLEYEKYHRVAPGVVLIKSPGHSVGHQFIFVQLQNGNEFLFTGDVVWIDRNFETLKNRPWITSKKRIENRHQIAHQMRYLFTEFCTNKKQKIYRLSTHDPKQHKEYINKGLINSELQFKET